MGNVVFGFGGLVYSVYCVSLWVNLYISTLVDASCPLESPGERGVFICGTKFFYESACFCVI